MWLFFTKNYDGGPEILSKNEKISSNSSKNTNSKDSYNKQFSTIDNIKNTPYNKPYSTIDNHKNYSSSDNNKNKIYIKNDYKTYVQETKVEHMETESIRNDECTGTICINFTVISEGNVNEVYSNKYNSNNNGPMIRITQKIDERVEIDLPPKLKQILNISNRTNKNKK